MNSLIKKALFAATTLISVQNAYAEMNEIELDFFDRVNVMLKPNNVTAYNVSMSAIPSYFEVDLSDGKTIIVSSDGAIGIVSGNRGAEIYDFKQRINMTKERKALLALDYVEKNKPLLTYKAERETGKIFIFADIQCGYCQSLHMSIPELNAAGISVLYFPVAQFENSDLYMNAAYCSEDPNAKYTELTNNIGNISANARSKAEASGGGREAYNKEMSFGKARMNAHSVKIINNSECETYDMENAAKHANGFGIVGTPNILFPSGLLVVGKMEVPDIIKTLDSGK